ncbi:hypothetical protein ACFYOT_26680 [Saccharothrix saharensis]|uniref:hypothetical protein n=1 Tax=Saccharothrix saharensis TaxID=571190 RepID=UPI0036D177C4
MNLLLLTCARSGSRVRRKLGEGSDPSVRLDLVGVDVNAILDRVVSLDQQAARRKLIREPLFSELGLTDTAPPP